MSNSQLLFNLILQSELSVMAYEKKLILFQFLGPNNQFFNELGADKRNQFVYFLKNEIVKKGFIPEPLKDQRLENVFAIIFFDLHSVYPIYGNFFKKLKFIIFNFLRRDTSSRNIFKEELKSKNTIKKYLIAFEPRIICPDNFNSLYSNLFDRTFSWSGQCCGGKSKNTIINLPIPQVEFKPLTAENFISKRLLVTVSSNKGSYKKGSLCDFKYNAYELIFKNLGNNFNLFGYMWDQSLLNWFLKFIRGTKSKYFYKLPPYFKGVVSGKDEVLSKYRFCLVIENMSERSFITEKIFHAIIAGCVPIYLGAPNICEFIPKKTFVDLRDFENWNKLCIFIRNYNKQDYEEFLISRESFLKSPQYKSFSAISFANLITSNIFK